MAYQLPGGQNEHFGIGTAIQKLSLSALNSEAYHSSQPFRSPIASMPSGAPSSEDHKSYWQLNLAPGILSNNRIFFHHTEQPQAL
ncbi:hypothetical protein WAI453_011932 [Rhynchosporium graminicola]